MTDLYHAITQTLPKSYDKTSYLNDHQCKKNFFNTVKIGQIKVEPPEKVNLNLISIRNEIKILLF